MGLVVAQTNQKLNIIMSRERKTRLEQKMSDRVDQLVSRGIKIKMERKIRKFLKYDQRILLCLSQKLAKNEDMLRDLVKEPSNFKFLPPSAQKTYCATIVDPNKDPRFIKVLRRYPEAVFDALPDNLKSHPKILEEINKSPTEKQKDELIALLDGKIYLSDFFDEESPLSPEQKKKINRITCYNCGHDFASNEEFNKTIENSLSHMDVEDRSLAILRGHHRLKKDKLNYYTYYSKSLIKSGPGNAIYSSVREGLIKDRNNEPIFILCSESNCKKWIHNECPITARDEGIGCDSCIWHKYK